MEVRRFFSVAQHTYKVHAKSLIRYWHANGLVGLNYIHVMYNCFYIMFLHIRKMRVFNWQIDAERRRSP
jgi:hypothetical protein